MQLIYADAVKALVYEKIPLKLFMKRTIEGAHHSMGVLRSMIDELPAVDAEPVKHGRWIAQRPANPHVEQDEYECSLCHRIPIDYKSNYCPACGAKMDGGEEYE